MRACMACDDRPICFCQPDDTEEKCKVRIATYKKNYEAIAGQYGSKIVVVDGNRAPAEVNVEEWSSSSCSSSCS